MSKPNPIIFIVGPTATGKTQLSFLLAKSLQGHILSCDSMLIYKQARIINASPDKTILESIPHYFVAEVSVEDNYNVFDYYLKAKETINDLIKGNITVIVCGGSGLYVKALLDGVFEGGCRDDNYRNQLNDQLKQYGQQYLYDQLKKVDPKSATKIALNDIKRIIRALEVYYVTGKPLSEKKSEAQGLYGKIPIRIFGLNLPREKLYERINQRVEDMFSSGAVEEVNSLLEFKLSLTASKIIGIKEIEGFLNGNYSLAEAKELMKKNTRNFAKRQLTWFKADKRIEWLDIDNLDTQAIKDIILQTLSMKP